MTSLSDRARDVLAATDTTGFTRQLLELLASGDWRLLPVKPTEEMIKEMYEAQSWGGSNKEDQRDSYDEMLSASPDPFNKGGEQ